MHLFPDTRTILDISWAGHQGDPGRRRRPGHRLPPERQVRRRNRRLSGEDRATSGLTTEDIGPYAMRSTAPKAISSVCAVFAESEVMPLSNGIPAEDIMMGAMVSLGGRAIQLMRRAGLQSGYMLTGGMRHERGDGQGVEQSLGRELPRRTQRAGAVERC